MNTESMVTQADREAAAAYCKQWENNGGEAPASVHPEFLITGEHDDDALIQAFARHRLSSQGVRFLPGYKNEDSTP
jgi:hypothetical protein